MGCIVHVTRWTQVHRSILAIQAVPTEPRIGSRLLVWQMTPSCFIPWRLRERLQSYQWRLNASFLLIFRLLKIYVCRHQNIVRPLIGVFWSQMFKHITNWNELKRRSISWSKNDTRLLWYQTEIRYDFLRRNFHAIVFFTFSRRKYIMELIATNQSFFRSLFDPSHVS